jgi:UPF0271 protein
VMEISPEDLYADIMYQSGALEAFLRPHGLALNHIKPHGALYPMLNRREDLAEAAARALTDLMPAPVLYWPAGSEDRALLRVARQHGIRVVREFYPDSRYGADGETVVERHRMPMSPEAAEAATRRFLTAGAVETMQGTVIPLQAESICVHGDGPTAAAIVDRVIAVLDELGHPLRAATAAQTKDVNA